MKQPKYKGGQCIQLKPYQELRDNLLSSVYSDEMLRKLGNALFTIYGTLSEERNEVWYQLGEYGHNVLQVPESYIKCEYRADVEQAPTAPENKERKMTFEEFDDLVRATVHNCEYTYQELAMFFKYYLGGLKAMGEPIARGSFKKSLPVNPFSVVLVIGKKEPLHPEALRKIAEEAGVGVGNIVELKYSHD